MDWLHERGDGIRLDGLSYFPLNIQHREKLVMN